MTRRRALLTGALVSTLAFLALAWVADERALLVADRSMQTLVQARRNPELERPVQLLTRLGSGWVTIPISIVAVALLARRHRELAVFVAAVSAGGHLLSPVAKWLVARPRPKLSAYGFPSGHTLAAVVVFGALMYVAGALIERPAPRWLAIVVCGVIIVGVAVSRLYLNSHWTTDVAGGLTGGLAVLLFGLVWLEGRAVS
jgi:undecaprenyl-diphosphatase